MKYYLFKIKEESLSDIFQSSFESVTFRTKKQAKDAAESFVKWSKENEPYESVEYSLYEMNILRVKK